MSVAANWDHRLEQVVAGDEAALEEALQEVEAGRSPDLATQARFAAEWECVLAVFAHREAGLAVLSDPEHADARLLHAFEVSRSAMRGLPYSAPLRPAFAALVVEGLVTHGETILRRPLRPGTPASQQQWMLGAGAVGLAWQLADLGGLEEGQRARLALRLLQISTPAGGVPAALQELRACAEILADASLAERATVEFGFCAIWLQFGDYERVLPKIAKIKQELAGAPAAEDHSGIGMVRVLATEATALILAGTPLPAVGVLESARRLAAQASPEVLPLLRYASAYALLDAGDPQGCLANLREPDIQPLTLMGSARLDLLAGRALHALGDTTDAAVALRNAREAGNGADPETMWRSASELAAIREEAGERGEALGLLVDATTQIELFRGRSLGYRLDSTSLRIRLPVFRDAIRLAAGAGQADRAGRLIESVKQRGIDALFGVERAAAADPGDRIELENLSGQLDELEYQAIRFGGWSPDAVQQAGVLAERRAGVLEALAVEDAFERVPVQIEGDDLHPGADTAELTLFFDQPRATVVAVLRHGGLADVQEQPLATETLAALNAYRDNLISPAPDYAQFDPDQALDLHAESIVAPGILARALEASSLVIAPHGPLHLLPWPSLSFAGQRLIESLPVGMVPSLTMARQLRRRPLAAAPSVAVIGAPSGDRAPALDDLPLAGLELDDVAALYAAQRRLLAPEASGPAGSQAAFFALAQRRDAGGHILHVACHGALDAEDPLSAGLMLVDGKVDVAELSRLRISYGEVVLSTCSSGWRPLRAQGVELLGDDAVSLTGSLLTAGAGSVLASIPRAFDAEAHELMTAYHAKRIAGVTPMVAVREVQLEALSGGVPPHTVTGFVVNGCR